MLLRVAAALTFALKLFSLYFIIVALFALKKRTPGEHAAAKTRFACLIPARNEEAVIAALVESLHAQNYPAALFDVYVIPNNCTDRTEELARASGAKILRCFEAVRCKGDALHEAVQALLPRGYDAFCVFDADNVIHPDFLARMNDAITAGARVVKGRITAKNPEQSGVSGCYAVYHTIFNHLFNQARENLRLSARLVGTGFAVHRSLLQQLGGWNTETMTEDAEFAAQCALIGERVWYAPQAVTYDEAPATFALSLRQRLRWCAGIMENARRSALPLMRELGTVTAPLALDELLLLLAPYAQILGIVLFPLTLLCALKLGISPLLPGAGAAASFLCLFLTAAFIMKREHFPCLRTALLFPLFMLSWLPLQIAALFCRQKSWQVIPHTGAAAGRAQRAVLSR